MPGILDSLFGVNPMLDGYLQQANKQSTAFIPQLQDTFSSAYASSLGSRPEIMSATDFMESKGFKSGNPFNIFKKGYGKLGKEYRAYKRDQEAQIGAYDQKITDYNSGLGDNLKNAFGALSVLMKGNQAENAYNLKPKLDLTESPSFEGYHYQMGSEVYDPLRATSAIESNHMNSAVSPVGAVSAFQIMGGGALAQYNKDKSTNYSVADVAAKPELAKVVSSYFNDYLYKQAEKKGVTYDSEVTKQIANRMAYYKGESFFSPFKNKKVTMGDLFSNDVPKDVRYHGLKHYNYIKQKNLDVYPENPYSPTYKPSYLHNQYGNTVKRYTEEETYRLLNDPSKYVVSKDPDPTLLYSGIRQVYDREGNQIAYQNKEGQFNTLQKGAMRFEGKPSGYTMGVDKEKSYITPYGDPRAQLLSSIAKYQKGSTVSSSRGGGSSWENKSSTEQMMDFLKAGIQSALGMETGTIFDRVPMPSNELGIIGRVAGASKAAKYIKSLFSRAPIKKQVSKELLDEFGEKLATGDINWKNIPGTQYHISAYGGKHTGRNVLMVRDKNGIVQPFYQRTGKGTRPTDRPEAFNTEGTWVPFYGVGKANMPKGNVISDHWFVKPSGMRSGSEMDQYTSDILNKFIGTGSRGDDFFKKNWPYEFSGDPKIINELFKLHGYDINMVPKNLGYNPNELQMYQEGGPVNKTGYTPGTPTYSNPYNIIPSSNITMNQTPFNVMGYPIYNNKLGNPQLMRPGYNYNFKGAKGVLEIPHAQFGLNLGYAPFIDALNDPLSLKRAQLAEMPPMQSDRNLAMNTVPRPSPIFTPPPADEIPEIEREQVLTLPYDSVYEYKKTPIGWEFRKKGETAWTKARTKSGIEAIERAFGAQGAQNSQGAQSGPQQGGSQQTTPQQNAPQPAQTPQEIRTYGNNWRMDPYNPARLTGRKIRTNYPDDYPASPQGFANRYFPRIPINTPNDSRSKEQYNADIMKGYSSLYNPSVYGQPSKTTESVAPKKTTAAPQNSDKSWFAYPDPGTIAPYEFGDDASLGEVLGSTLLGIVPGGGYQGARLTAQGVKAAIPKLAATLSKLKKGYESFKSSRKATKLIKDIEKTTNVKKAKNIESLMSSGQTSKYQFGGDVQGQEPKIVPIQTEKGEMLYHTDGKITDVLAKKKHSKMHDDDITDAVVEGGFVASDDPAMKISKKEAADYVVGYKPMEYSEKSSKAAEPIRFSEMFTKGQMKPSEILRKIRSKTKSDGRNHDVFSARADEENREIRDMWVEPLKYFTELKKPVEIPQFRYGGMIKKYPIGGDVLGAILGAGTDIAGMLTTAADKRKTLADIGQYETDNIGALNQNNLLQQGLTFGNYLSQDNTPEFANYDPALNAVNSGYNRILQSMPGRLSQARNANMSQYNSISRNLGKIANPQRASAIAAGLYGRGITANNQLALQYANQEDAYRSRQADALANIYGSKALNDQATRTGVRSNRNLLNAGLFKDLGSNATNFLTGKMNVKNTALTARMMARKQANQAISNGFSNLGNNISGIFSAVSQQKAARKQREMDELGDIGQGIFNSPFSFEPYYR